MWIGLQLTIINEVIRKCDSGKEREEERQPTEDKKAKNSEQIRKREIEQQIQQQMLSLD